MFRKSIYLKKVFKIILIKKIQSSVYVLTYKLAHWTVI